MNTHADKTQENKSQAVANEVSQKPSSGEPTFQFMDNRPEAIAQRKLQEIANSNPRVMQLKALQEMVNKSPQVKQASRLQSIADSRSAKQQPIQKKKNNTGLSVVSYINTKSVSSLPIQRAKDAQEMEGVDGFNYEDIISWDGTPCEHHGITFISDETVYYMNANSQTMEVRYNPDQIGQMTPQSRYFLILHELGHIYYQHPGNDHPDSVENEIQADDTALVNAVTLYPEESLGVINDFSALLQFMVDQGEFGGNTHPLNVDRKSRIEQLLIAILDNATLDVKFSSTAIPKDHMDHFLMENGDALMLDSSDIKTFQADNGTFSFIDGGGQPTLRIFLQWLPEFRLRQHLIPDFNYTYNWEIRPVQIQNQIKDDLP